MDGYRLDLSSPPDWRPLEQLSRLLAESDQRSDVSAQDFMYMGRLVSRTCPPIHLYKHQASRAYLSLDALGHCHRLSRTGATVTAKVTGLTRSLDRLSATRAMAAGTIAPDQG